jgi:hypothetical protein
VQLRLDGVSSIARLNWEGVTGAASLLGDGAVEINLPPVSGAIFQLR